MRKPFLDVEVPSTGNSPQPPYRKMRETQITFYIAVDGPRPSGGG